MKLQLIQLNNFIKIAEKGDFFLDKNNRIWYNKITKGACMTNPSLRQLPSMIWRPNRERQSISGDISLLHSVYLGVDKPQQYNDILATIHDKVSNDPMSVLFDTEIPMVADFDFISAINSELTRININHIQSQDVQMFPDVEQNERFINALQYTVNLAISQESFANDNVRNSFICKMLLNTNTYIRELVYDESATNKAIYYGNISKHDLYFMIMLSKFGFETVIINPVANRLIYDKDVDNVLEITSYQNTLPVESFKNRAQQGTIIHEQYSMILDLENQLDDTLHTNGVYRPWQFRDGNVKPLLINGALIDLTENWNQPAKVRDGFHVKDKTVYNPVFFMEIEGETISKDSYYETWSQLTNNPLTYITSGNPLSTPLANPDDRYQLSFVQNFDKSFDIEKLKTLSFYTYEPYNDDTEDYILNTINDVLSDMSLFKQPLTDNERYQLVIDVLTLNKDILRLIDSYDFTSNIPKLVYELKNETQLTKQTCLLLAYFHKLGFDVVILSPAGLSNVDSVITPERMTKLRLDTMVYDESFNPIRKQVASKKGFLTRLFG